MQLLLYQEKYLALFMMQMRPIVDVDKLFGGITKGTNIKIVQKKETHSVNKFSVRMKIQFQVWKLLQKEPHYLNFHMG